MEFVTPAFWFSLGLVVGLILYLHLDNLSRERDR